MQLYIRIKDGSPFEHPITEINLRQAFPHVDTNNLPPEFAKFERVPRPTLGPYEVLISETSTYELVDGVYKDVWRKRDMTNEEIVKKQQQVKNNWKLLETNFSSWVFNEQTCAFEAPVPMPTDGKQYRWNEELLSWIETNNA